MFYLPNCNIHVTPYTPKILNQLKYNTIHVDIHANNIQTIFKDGNLPYNARKILKGTGVQTRGKNATAGKFGGKTKVIL